MKFHIIFNEQLIGESNLENHDKGMNIYSGKFWPTVDYRLVKPVYLLFGHATINPSKVDESLLNKYYQARDKLNLKVLDEGHQLFPSESIHIIDYSFDPEIGEDYLIEVYPSSH
jgi:hypothetical protein